MAKTEKTAQDASTTRISGQKGRPQARPTTRAESKAPATRPQARPATTGGKAPKAAASPSSARVSGAKAPAAAPGRPRARSTAGQEPFQSTRDAMASRRTPVAGNTNRPSTGPARPETRPRARPDGIVSIDQWRRLTRKQRQDMGLPTSEIGAQVYSRRLQSGM